MYFEKEFKDLVQDFEENLEDKHRGVGYSFLGSPLMQSKCVIVGNNPRGVETDIFQQKEMPRKIDILDPASNCETYRGYRSFFTLLFQDDKSKACSFLHKSVYTNACFIRTPNEGNYPELLDYGYKYSRDFLVRILLLVKPKLIIAFGNGDKPVATSALVEILGIGERYWTDENVEQIQLANSQSSYIIEDDLDSKRIELFSFPHASKYKIWSPSLESKKTFVELRKRIISLCQIQTKQMT